jgi:hypothetical protein
MQVRAIIGIRDLSKKLAYRCKMKKIVSTLAKNPGAISSCEKSRVGETEPGTQTKSGIYMTAALSAAVPLHDKLIAIEMPEGANCRARLQLAKDFTGMITRKFAAFANWPIVRNRCL